MKLTTASVRALQLPPGSADKTFFDPSTPAFGVRLRAGGSKHFVVQYKLNGKHRRMVLGPVSTLDLGKARDTAKDILAKVRLGQDPAGDRLDARHRDGETFGAQLPRFLSHQRARLKPRSFVEIDRHLSVYAKTLHDRHIDEITRRDIALLLGEIADTRGPTAGNRTRASLSGFFTWMVREGLIDSNVVLATNKQAEAGARERLLSDEELAAIWRKAGDGDYGTILKLLVLTGARRDEIGALKRSEIDLDKAMITLPPERTKNRRQHIIPLSPAAVDLLRTALDGSDDKQEFVFGRVSGRPFSGWSKSKSEIDARLGDAVAPWTPHDFRRSISTGLHERGIAPHVIESLLGHVGHKTGVAGVYNRAEYLDERRAALARWASHIESLISKKPSKAKVVNLRG